MKAKLALWGNWFKQRPTAVINLVGILLIVIGGSSYIGYQTFRSLDVLEDWTIELSDPKEHRVIDSKRYAVYHPNESLIFTSKSTKLIDAKGSTSRMIVCEPTATQPEREIQLDTLPAVRPAGFNPERDNAITVPDVAKFSGLPRYCKLVIDITYEGVALGRSHSEHAETETFIVEERKLDSEGLKRQIEGLQRQIDELQSQLQPTSKKEQSATTEPIVIKPDTPQQDASPQVAQEQPAPTKPAPSQPENKGLIERVLEPINNLLGR